MNQDMILGIARHLLTTAGGVLVANGTITGSQLQDGVGAVLALAGIAWSIWQKHQASVKLAAAVAAPAVPPKA